MANIPEIALHARLQVGIELNTDADPEMEIRVTPADVPIPDSLARELRAWIGIADLADVTPGDGEADIPLRTHIRLPIRIAFLNLKNGIDVPIVGDVFLKVKD